MRACTQRLSAHQARAPLANERILRGGCAHAHGARGEAVVVVGVGASEQAPGSSARVLTGLSNCSRNNTRRGSFVLVCIVFNEFERRSRACGWLCQRHLTVKNQTPNQIRPPRCSQLVQSHSPHSPFEEQIFPPSDAMVIVYFDPLLFEDDPPASMAFDISLTQIAHPLMGLDRGQSACQADILPTRPPFEGIVHAV